MIDYSTPEPPEWVREIANPAPRYVADGHYDPFARIPHYVIDQYAAKVGVHAFAVYCYLVKVAGQKMQCYPSVATVAEAMGMKRDTAARALKVLQDAGLISIHERHTDHGQTTNLYLINDMSPNGHPLPVSGGGALPVSVYGAGVPKRGTEKEPSKKDADKKDDLDGSEKSAPSGVRRSPNYQAEFEAFWEQTPKRGVKMNAWAEWVKLPPADWERIMAVIPTWRSSEEWNREPKYIMHIERWLKYRHFDDEPTPNTGAKPNGNGSTQRPGPGETWQDVFDRERRAMHMPVDDTKGDEPW